MRIKDDFFALSSALNNKLTSEEVLLCTFYGEDSDFVRLNNNRIRQAGSVNQYEFGLQLINGQRHCFGRCNISGQQTIDLERLSRLLESLREQNQHCLEDAYLLYNTEPWNSEITPDNQLPDSQQIIEQLIEAAAGLDLVGIYASGTLYHGFANSLGQHNWQTHHQFNLDWSCYLNTDKAVKSQYAGSQWQPGILEQKFDNIHQQLALLSKPSIALKPGDFRCYLSPTALSSILEIACWGGFGLKSHHTKNSPLIKLNEQNLALDTRIRISENNRDGFTPSFTQQGFIKPKEVVLIDQGIRADYLVSSRSAKEYNSVVNAQSESPQSLQLSAGRLATTDLLSAIGTGLYISNLWYTNFSDRGNCRITGMTRFACFYIENGIIKAPIEVMRFDQSLYELLGDKLIDLSAETQCLASTDTYQRRSSSSMTLPGILVDGFKLSF
jgi:predicted Zn-dependent protease